MQKVKENMFGGEDGEAQNALMQALKDASEGDVYDFMENTPKTAFIVELHDALQELGYEIKKK